MKRQRLLAAIGYATIACAAAIGCTNDFGQFGTESSDGGVLGDGTVDATPDRATADVATADSTVDAPGDDGSEDATTNDASDDGGGDAGTDAPADANGDAPVTCGTPNLPCCPNDAGGSCSTGCCDPQTNHCVANGVDCRATGTVCASGTCTACGDAGDICCANQTCPVGCCDPGSARCVNTGVACAPADGGTVTVCANSACSACGGKNQPCCAGANACATDAGPLACASGVCTTCGANGDPCCAGNTCTSSTVICTGDGGTCTTCGGSGDPCCTADGGPACADGGLACAAGTCTACGGATQPCCAGSSCTGGGCCDPSDTKCVAPSGACTTNGTVCASGTCQGCGDAGGPCCASNTCFNGGCCDTFVATPTCVAANTTCPSDNGAICASGSCQACGTIGAICCAASTCKGTPGNFGCCDPGNGTCVNPGSACSATGSTCIGDGGYCCGAVNERCCPTNPKCTTGLMCGRNDAGICN